MIEKFSTRRFGEIAVDKSRVLTLPEGLWGFPDCRRYLLLEGEEHAPFIWMQSLDDPDLCFVTADPLVFFPDYRIQSTRGELASIQLADVEKARVLVILVVPENPAEITANLQGPLVVNTEMRLGKQLVLLGDAYTTKHRVFPALEAETSTPSERESSC